MFITERVPPNIQSNPAILHIGAVTRMEEHARIQASRRAHKAHTTRILNKCKDILAKENPDEMEINSLNTSLDQLVRKRTLISKLDQKIEAKITDAKELESESFKAEELSCELEEKINHIRKFIDLSISTINIQSNVVAQENIGTSSSAISQNTNAFINSVLPSW